MRARYQLVAGLLWALSGVVAAEDHDHDHGHDHGHEDAPPLGFDITEAWLDKWVHRHSSATGTPLVHAFLTEPAFLGRDLFVTFAGTGAEKAVEVELEWALTRRLGLIAEVPWVDTGEESGVADSVLALRGLLIEKERFLFSLTAEAGLPTGSESKGLGSGAWGWGAIFNAWGDLGHWFTLQGAGGIERVPALSETAFVWSFTFSKSFRVPPLFKFGREAHGVVPALSLLAEIAGETGLSSGSGPTEGLWLLGVTYSITRSFDFRAGYTRGFRGGDGWIVGFVLHF
jgi:hypothetical protein